MVTVARLFNRGLLISALLFSVAGCYTEKFNFSEQGKKRFGVFDCHILTPYGSVENDNTSITVHPGGVLAVRRYKETFEGTECFVSVTKGSALRVRMRSVDFGRTVFPGIALTLGKEKSFVQHNTDAPRQVAPVLDPNGGMTHIGFFSEAGNAVMTVGCDTVFCAKSPLPATDVIVFESVDSSEFVIHGLTARNYRSVVDSATADRNGETWKRPRQQQ